MVANKTGGAAPLLARITRARRRTSGTRAHQLELTRLLHGLRASMVQCTHSIYLSLLCSPTDCAQSYVKHVHPTGFWFRRCFLWPRAEHMHRQGLMVCRHPQACAVRSLLYMTDGKSLRSRAACMHGSPATPQSACAFRLA